MSNPKKSNKKEPPKKTPEEEENDKLIDEALPEDEVEEEIYEDYDPNDVYDEDGALKEDIIDVNKLTEKQKAKYLRDNKRVFFLKALSVDPYFDLGRLAKKCKLSSRGEAETCVQVMIGMIMETSKDKDFPARVLKYFNTLVPDGYPNKATLNEDDINELINLTRVLEDKLINQAKVTNPDEVFGPEVNAETIKESKEKKKIVMMDELQSQPFSQQTNEQSHSRNSMEYYLSRHAIPDIGLMEFVLTTIPNPRPNSVQPFIINFSDLYTDWMQNPLKMLEQLKFSFGPTHGEHMFRVWRDYRDNFQKKQGYNQVGGFGNDYMPYQGFNQYNGGFQPMQVSPEVEAERMMDKRMDKLMKMLQFKMMNQAMENQTPLPMSGQGYEEIYDQNGKVIKRIMLPNGHANGSSNPMESAVFQGMVNMMQEIVRGKNQEMVEIMRNQNQPTNLLTDFAKTMLSNQLSNQNPMSQIKEMLDITNMVKAQSPQTNEAKSIEQTRLEIDSKLAMHELDLKKMEIQHNWKMDENQLREQDSNVDKWLNTLQGMGESIIKPVAIKFLEGFGKGQIPGGPLNGAFTNPTLQTPIGANEQDYAMRQQQYYENMERERQRPIPPMQPIPPRQFNPQPPQQQQYAPQRTISAASERDIEQELQSLSPQQIQEIEDKMAIDDINREKVKNAIRAYKNGRRVSRPRPAEQVTEAQNVLFNPPQQEEELDELDFEDEEEEYQVPIARGDAKIAPEQKPTKKFSDYEVRSTTEIAKTKKLNDQQKAMLSEGQMTERELAQIEDIDDDYEEDEYSSGGVPLPAGIYNESNEKLKEENLSNTKQTPKKKSSPKKKPEPVIDKVDEAQEQKEIDEAEKLLMEAEEIPSDDE